MKALISTLSSIGEAISSLFNFLWGMIQDLLYVISLLGQFVASIPDYFSWLPAECLALVITAVGVAVIYKLLGRE